MATTVVREVMENDLLDAVDDGLLQPHVVQFTREHAEDSDAGAPDGRGILERKAELEAARSEFSMVIRLEMMSETIKSRMVMPSTDTCRLSVKFMSSSNSWRTEVQLTPDQSAPDSSSPKAAGWSRRSDYVPPPGRAEVALSSRHDLRSVSNCATRVQHTMK